MRFHAIICQIRYSKRDYCLMSRATFCGVEIGHNNNRTSLTIPLLCHSVTKFCALSRLGTLRAIHCKRALNYRRFIALLNNLLRILDLCGCSTGSSEKSMNGASQPFPLNDLKLINKTFQQNVNAKIILSSALMYNHHPQI